MKAQRSSEKDRYVLFVLTKRYILYEKYTKTLSFGNKFGNCGELEVTELKLTKIYRIGKRKNHNDVGI